MATAVSTQLSALTGSNTVQQMMSDVNSLKTLSALATDAAGSGDFVPTSGGTFTGNLGIEKNGATTLTLTRTNSSSNFAEIEAAGGSGEQLTIKSNVSNQTGGFTAFDVGGSERLRVDSSGHVLIGTTSSTTDLAYDRKLKISGSGPALILEETDTSQMYTISTLGGSLIIRDATNTAGRVTIDSSGNVGIGTSNPSFGNSNLKVTRGITAINGSSTSPYFQLYNNNAGTDQKTWRIGGIPSGDLTFETVNDAYSASISRMLIASTGDITFKQGVVNLESTSGNPAQMNFYCESGNAHYTRIQSSPHASYSGNVVLTLPTTSGTLATTGKAIAMAIVFG